MPKISKEPIHRQWDESKRQWDRSKDLLPGHVVVVKVASFTFRFESTEQLRKTKEYYERKTHPSSMIAARVLAEDLGEDWREQRAWEVERWFERLPMYLLEEPKRQKVVKALDKALALVAAGKL